MGRPKENIEVPGQAEPVLESETATPESEELQSVVEQAEPDP
ncbi:hypothetical protein [Tenebrionicola larvae]|jgi:hypothetical protein|nr:hypothetical protein [Tenebrionicola larvae]